MQKPLQRAISSLRTVARLEDHPAPALADLSAAYLVRAERAHTPRDLLAAIDAADEALEHDPHNPVARFNLALALQRFGLVEEAADRWRAYLAADSVGEWAVMARRNLQAALAVAPPLPPPAVDAPESAYAAYAAADPQGGRILGWCGVLGAWGEARLAGDGARAEAQLRRAEALAGALERRPGGDATLADAVRAIRASGASRNLARAHVEFAAGSALADRTDFPAAAPHFAAAAAAAEGSSVLRAWAWTMYGDMVFHSGEVPEGEAILRRAVAAADPVHHPALAARARQALAALLVRGDRYTAAMDQAQQASVLFARAAERENEGVALDVMASAQFLMHDMDAGYVQLHRALERVGQNRSSYRLQNLLNFAAGVARDDGFPRAAMRVQDEGVRVAERTGNPVFVAESRLTRARLRAAAGDLPRAVEDVAEGRKALARITIPKARAWMAALRQIAEAASSLRARPARAAAALDSAAAFLKEMRAPLIALPAVVDGTQARLAAGDVPGATARLETALRMLEQRRDSIRMEPRRAAVFEAARTMVDRVTMLKLAAGSGREALAYLDRGRASLAPVGRAAAPDASRGVAGPPGEVAVEYALVGDTLLAWTVEGTRVESFHTVVDTLRLVRTIDRVRGQLEDLADESELRPGLATLYDWLVRPVAGRLGGMDKPLVVVADGDLAAVPFAALYDAVRGRYLVETHPLRFVASLREARRPAARWRGAQQALFVADPAFDTAEQPGFPRLSQAAVEAREIASEYRGAWVLSGEAATGSAVRTALGGARMFHFAGHAVFDDERPERSYLLLASAPGHAGRSTLEAGEIAQLDLSHLSLVVLSGCQTLRTGKGRAAGFSGLAGAFLAAGAGGAVGSLWEVDDRLTRPLMVEFHRAYRGSGSGPRALRAAQLRLLQSPERSLRSPAAWAGFRYMGG